MTSLRRLALSMSMAFLLSGCGGGGGGSNSTTGAATNRAPVAVASSSLAQAYSSQAVTLNGNGSADQDGSIASFQWVQTSGPSLSITNGNTASASWTVPPVSEQVTFTFRLTVTDNAGAAATATTSVVVDPAPVQLGISVQGSKAFLVDDELAVFVRSNAQFLGSTIVPDSVTWRSSIQGVLGGNSSQSTARTLQAGLHTISVSADFGVLGTTTRTLTLPVLPRKSAVTPFQATPVANAASVMPVVLINYIPTRDGISVDAAVTGPTGTIEWRPGSVSALQDWISTITTRAKFMLEEGSRFRGYKNAAAAPYIGYRVVEIYNYYEEMPRGFPDPAISGNVFPDYQAILSRIPAQDLVDSQGVKEFWLYSYHFGTFSLNESNMASPTTGDVSNSYRTAGDLPVFSKTYVLYQNNYTRSHAEAVHNHGHQIEAMMAHVNLIRDGNTNLFWRQFVGLNSSGVFTPGRCGATHFPLNATTDYDYNNATNVVQSNCEDWRPDGSGTMKASTLSTWADVPYAWPGVGTISQKAEAQWYIFWMQNLPGAGNVIPLAQTTMENWWQFIADWDGSIQSGKKLYK